MGAFTSMRPLCGAAGAGDGTFGAAAATAGAIDGADVAARDAAGAAPRRRRSSLSPSSSRCSSSNCEASRRRTILSTSSCEMLMKVSFGNAAAATPTRCVRLSGKDARQDERVKKASRHRPIGGWRRFKSYWCGWSWLSPGMLMFLFFVGAQVLRCHARSATVPIKVFSR